MWKLIAHKKGSLTLEACISFSLTFLVIISFMFFIKVVYVHSVIQHAVTQTANELANYSYLYSVSPLAPQNDLVVDSTAGNVDKLNYDIQEVVDLWDSYTQAGQAVTTIKTKVESPKDLLKAVISVFVNGANEDAKTFMGSLVCKALMEKYISVPNKDANSRLQTLQVIGGINGLDFSNSRFFADKQTIDLVVCYQLKNITPLNIMPEIYLLNRATVRGWLNNGGSGQSTNTVSIWDPSFSDLQRGVIIQKEAGLRNLPNSFKTFSHFENGVATACMSMDPREASYTNESGIKSKIKKKCEEIKNFNSYEYAGFKLAAKDISERRLVIFVPVKNEKNPDVDSSSVKKTVADLKAQYPDIIIELREIDKEISK